MLTDTPPHPQHAPRQATWISRLAVVLRGILCFELGIFLLLFPWLSNWNVNWIGRLPEPARDIWVSPWFRGAVSGLGLANIYIAFAEVSDLLRSRSSSE